MLLKPDTRLGHYVIREHKADGGMGAVYRARDTRHGGREVAIKTILADKASDRDLLSRFRLEALAIAQIDHPNIVKLIEFVEGDATRSEPSYMVMEFLKGDDLGRIIKKGGALEITRAVDLMLEVCAAVGTCHRRGYVHRDLKPSNIFVAVYDQIETVKVLDFGVAKAWAEVSVTKGRYGELTRKGMVFGTPEYLAPELLKGEQATPKVDQYAIGVVLYTALTGRKPFLANPDAEFREIDIMHAVSKGDHPPARSLRPEVPQGLDDAVERAMHRDPSRRFDAVHALGAALLPYASTPARHRYTAHFTSTPVPVAVRAQLSIAIGTPGEDATIPSAQFGRSSTLAVEHVVTRPVGSTELRVMAGGESRATTIREQPIDAPGDRARGGSSTSTSVEEPDRRGSGHGHPSGDVGAVGSGPRPARLLAGAAALTALALGLAFTLHRARPKPLVPPVPPASILSPSTERSREPSPSTPPAQVPVAPRDEPLARSARNQPSQSPQLAPADATARPHRSAHRRRIGPVLDERGVPIPTF